VQKELLLYFAENPCLSAYEIHSRYKKTKYYKNVNKPVRQLHELGLIEKVQKESIQKGSKHKAIPYRLSTGGIYNLIHKQRSR
jgi:predicted transcriptional regulator